MGSDHLPIEISIDAPPHRNSSANHSKYKFDQTDREVFESTLEAVLGSEEFSGLMYGVIAMSKLKSQIRNENCQGVMQTVMA